MYRQCTNTPPFRLGHTINKVTQMSLDFRSYKNFTLCEEMVKREPEEPVIKIWWLDLKNASHFDALEAENGAHPARGHQRRVISCFSGFLQRSFRSTK